LERVLDTLVSLGLTRLDAEVYVFLAKKGPHKATDIISALGIYRQQFYNSLRSLKAKGIVNASPERSILYSAISIERVLDEFMKAKMEQTKALQASREELLSTWRSMVKKDSANS
jgi:sugar-specific transcriptional regulator TrmB